MRTDKERVLGALQASPNGVCVTVFWYGMEPKPIIRAAARVHDLKADGYTIVTETCDLHTHTGKARIVKYRLVREGQQSW